MLDIAFIKYRDKKYPVKLGYYTLKMFKAKVGTGISEIADDDFEAYEILLFYAMKQGAKRTDVEFAFKESDMEDVLDDCFFEFVELIPQFFPNQLGKPTPQQIKKK